MYQRIRRLFRLAGARGTDRSDAEAELELHLDLRAEELIAEGLSPGEARRRAESLLGDRRRLGRVLEQIDLRGHRAGRRREMIESLRRDATLAVRSLRSDPWFTAAAVAIVALSIGLNTIVLSALNTAFLRPLPYPEADRIVRVYELDGTGERMRVAGANARDWRRESRTLDRLAVFSAGETVLVDGGEPEYIHLASAGRELLDVLGAAPMVGRWIAPEEARPGAPLAAVIAEGLWRRRYGSRPDVVGRVVTIAGLSATIVGVLPGAAAFPIGTDMWISAEWTGDFETRTGHNWQVVARLRPGVSLEVARDEVTTLTERLTADFPRGDPFVARGADLESLRASLLGDQRSLLVMLQAAALLVLGIAAVNLANLLLVRAVRQRTELAVRAALGADRGHIVRRVLLEAVILTTASGALGIALAFPFRGALHAVLTRFLPLLEPPVIDLRVLLAALGGSALIGGLAAAVPAIRAASEDPNRVLGGASATRATRAHPIMHGLIAVEIALAMMLVAGTGLLVRSLTHLGRVETGFEPAGRIVVRIPNQFAFPTDTTPFEAAVARLDGVLAGARAQAGVERASLGISVPLVDWSSNATVELEPGIAPPGSVVSADFRIAGPDFFRTLGIPLRAGREFVAQDGPATPRVAVVNAEFARRFLGDRDPVGIRIRFLGMQRAPEPWATVVGVVGDVRHHGLGAAPVPEVYFSYRQRPGNRDLSLVLQARDRQGLEEPLRRLVRDHAPTAPFRAYRLESAMADALGGPRVRSLLLGLFAVLAVLLAAAGIFGVVAFIVAQRTREIGLRLALGSGPSAATRAGMRLVFRPLIVGLGLGSLGALLMGDLVRSFLFDTGTRDPVVLAAAALGLAGVSLLASYLPARRAARVDPVVALRAE